MIRRRLQNQEFLLFTQHDHALLAGRLAEHFGNDRFDPPLPTQETITAVAMHDCGWPLHDDEPTLNRERLPLHVFETPLSVALRVWNASAERVSSHPDYTQLLVSLHVLGLSGYAAGHVRTRHEVFELNKFQHHQIERQVTLRQRLGLAIDRPLRLGLAEAPASPSEEQLRRNHLILQAMDRISLGLCCTEIPFPTIDDVVPRPGEPPTTLRFTRTADFALSIDPWPFAPPSITLPIPCRALPAEPFGSLEEFRRAYAGAPVQTRSVTVAQSAALSPGAT